MLEAASSAGSCRCSRLPRASAGLGQIGRWVRAGVGVREGWRRVLWPSPVCDQARCVSGSSMSGSSLVTEGHSPALPLTAGTVRLRSVKHRLPSLTNIQRTSLTFASIAAL